MHPGLRRFVAVICVLLFAASHARAADAKVDFVKDVAPIFKQHCYECHGPDAHEAGLRLSRRDDAMAGGDSGDKAIVASKPGESRLIKLVSGQDPKLHMPPEDTGDELSAAELDVLKRWITEGAAWPAEADVPNKLTPHWAWKPPVQAPLPAVKNSAWCRGALDRFILARLEAEGLAPSPEADRYTLIRRVSFDVRGIPPTPAEVATFIADTSPDAYEKLVDRFLADPAYGERWARMWLDLARYADSKGYGSDPLRTIWRYRDWVIGAFNRNLPYDQFTIEQLAGDLLPNPTQDQLLATAFHRNTMANDEGGTDDEEFRVAAVKDRIETTMQVWMGLTAGCAKCHSHKFDPISQREYYQLLAFFNQTEDADRGDESPRLPTPTAEQVAQRKQFEQKIAEIQRQLAATTPELTAAEQAWEAQLHASDAAWQPVALSELTSQAGTKFRPLPDQSVLAEGTRPDRDNYTFSVTNKLPKLTAIRLETLPHETLPGGGPGRADNGNFVLSEMRITRGAGKQVAGRYVRVELAGKQKLLSLAEVQVFQGDKNLALAGKASQSSEAYGGAPARAIDGKTDGDYFKSNSVTHTAVEDNPWWEVDLGTSQPIERVVLWNRTDGNLQSRLAGCEVKVLDADHKPLWSSVVATAPNPNAELSVGGPTTIVLKDPVADYAQENWGVSKAIDGDVGSMTGWAISPQFGQAHTAVFPLAQPLESAEPTHLTFTVIQAYGSGHQIGHFRISITGETTLPQALPANIRNVVAIDPAKRTPQQVAELTQYFRTISPTLEPARKELAAEQKKLQELDMQVVTTPVLRELAEANRRKTWVMVKGNYLMHGIEVEPKVLSAFHPLPPGEPRNRLGLAHWLLDERNPMTARVAVNRYWSQIFSRGLVETEEDFGTQGTAPTHPELLDWLAVDFRRDWDMKRLVKTIVTSATYRQSSAAPADLVQKDPYNKLLARFPRKRLEAEMVRDQALALAGLLSHKQGGPSVFPPQPDGLWRAAFNGERTWATSKGEDRYRRGLYTFWRRTVPYPSMSTFDAPSREICSIRRIPTNTPLQALVTLNDPVYVEAAQALGRRLVREGGSTPQERVQFGLSLCMVRPPEPRQVQTLVELYQTQLAHYQTDLTAAEKLATDPLGPLPDKKQAAEMAAWTVVGNVLLNLDGVLAKR